MKQIGSLTFAVCAVCVAVSVVSSLVPQKRTAKIMSFVIGLFLTASILTAFADIGNPFSVNNSDMEIYEIPDYSGEDMDEAAVQMTADNLVRELDELMKNEGIKAEDIRLSLKITGEGRIYASRVVIYISEEYAAHKGDIERIVYGNLSKEPEIYVAGQEAE